jgi:NAD(P)-dependent dehydrogenase (short-subunit alcohol dehydrogenase family)
VAGAELDPFASLRQPDTLGAVVDRALDRDDRLDVLVNNAGVVDVHPAEDGPLGAFRQTIDVNLTRELSAQWAGRGIRVNALAPGWFESEMTEHMFSEEGRGGQGVARRAPLARRGREGELDGASLFLASDASNYVTGHVLAVDGG